MKYSYKIIGYHKSGTIHTFDVGYCDKKLDLIEMTTQISLYYAGRQGAYKSLQCQTCVLNLADYSAISFSVEESVEKVTSTEPYVVYLIKESMRDNFGIPIDLEDKETKLHEILDELDRCELLMILENDFNITIEDDPNMYGDMTLGELYKLVESKSNKN